MKRSFGRKEFLDWIVQNKNAEESTPYIESSINVQSRPHMDIIIKNEDLSLAAQGVLSSACFDEKDKEEISSCSLAAEIPEGETAEVSDSKTSTNSGVVNLYLENANFSCNTCLQRDSPNTLSDTCIQPNQVFAGSDVEISCAMVGPEHVNVNTSFQHPTQLKFTSKVKLEYLDNNLVSPAGDAMVGPRDSDLHMINMKKEIFDDFPDDDHDTLDHIMLRDRQRLLLVRKIVGRERGVVLLPGLDIYKDIHGGRLPGVIEPSLEDALCGLQDAFLGLYEPFTVGAIQNDFKEGSSSIPQISSAFSECQGTEQVTLKSNERIQENDRLCASLLMSTMTTSCDGENSALAIPNRTTSSSSSTVTQVKAEPLDKSNLQSRDENSLHDFCFNNIVEVKSELEISVNSHVDIMDHMPLKDRIKLLTAPKFSDFSTSRSHECLKGILESAPESDSVVLESAKPIRVKRLRKRKKSATDSIETALEEDAPGLLQVLIEKGVKIDEIRLYGEAESDEALDDSFSEDSFAELEAIIAKLFSNRNSMLKFAPIRCSKVSKANYCLACLISLVEQTRYLQRRKWPVEWGWCRDLQSFIFVFERHNRIVLERPEYGYATYFFEIVDSLPIDWQIKRLVIAMKLTSCSRVNIIENKPLLIGEDLTEGEARVLMEYGWIPNTGLGTMLNYFDRVVHDRKNEGEKDSSEWRAKIGKLLTIGYNGGSIVISNIPRKVVEYTDVQNPQIKLEF